MTETTFNSEKVISEFVSFEEFHQIKSRLKPGECLVVENTGNGFTFFVGKIKKKNVKEIAKMAPIGSPSNLDMGESDKFTRSKSWASPSTVMGFKSDWSTIIYSPKNHEDISVSWFMEELERLLSGTNNEELQRRVLYHKYDGKFYDKTVEITIKDYPLKGKETSVGFTVLGNARYLVYNGVKKEL